MRPDALVLRFLRGTGESLSGFASQTRLPEEEFLNSDKGTFNEGGVDDDDGNTCIGVELCAY